MLTAQKHTPKGDRANRQDLEAKRRRLDRESRTLLRHELLEMVRDDLAERRGHRAMIAAHYDPSVHEVPVVTFDPRTAWA